MWKSLICMVPILLSTYNIEIHATELILSAPPRESKEAGEKLYAPLAEFLSSQLGQPVKYIHPDSWFTYQNKMRDDEYDIVFDGPHFAAWRMAHLKHVALVRLPGVLQFYLVAQKDDSSTNTTNDLIGRYICGISPPNLSTLSILAHYNNPVRQPIIRGIKGGMGKVYKSLGNTNCSAAVLRTAFYKKKLTKEQQKVFKIIYTSAPLPNQVITVSRRISRVNMEKLQVAFTNSRQGAEALEPIRKRFAGKANSFVMANNSEFDGNNQLLEGVIFGW